MPDNIPSWLSTMRDITGTLEAPGEADNPTILAWAEEIAQRFPEMAGYARNYKHDATPWCGHTIAYCMAHNGIKPPYDPHDDLKSYLWVDAWLNFGTAADTPQPGDVMVFSSPHHVTMYEGENDT